MFIHNYFVSVVIVTMQRVNKKIAMLIEFNTFYQINFFAR